MKQAILLIAMLYAHIIDDYYLQGILASMKQRSWWLKNEPHELYKRDYCIALIEHAFSWAVTIHIPVIVYSYISADMTYNTILFAGLFIVSWIGHAGVDHMKANKRTISLLEDQLFHIAQIVMLWIVYALIYS